MRDRRRAPGAHAEIVADAWHVARILPPFPGRSRVGSAIDFLGVVDHESAFRADVDAGRCRPGDCDAGHALCLAQIHPANDEERAEVTGSRVGCFSVAWRRLRGSLRACDEMPGGGLALFTGGQCDDAQAVASSQAHMVTVHAWRARAARMVGR